MLNYIFKKFYNYTTQLMNNKRLNCKCICVWRASARIVSISKYTQNFSIPDANRDKLTGAASSPIHAAQEPESQVFSQ